MHSVILKSPSFKEFEVVGNLHCLETELVRVWSEKTCEFPRRVNSMPKCAESKDRAVEWSSKILVETIQLCERVYLNSRYWLRQPGTRFELAFFKVEDGLAKFRVARFSRMSLRQQFCKIEEIFGNQRISVSLNIP